MHLDPFIPMRNVHHMRATQKMVLSGPTEDKNIYTCCMTARSLD